MSIDVWLSVVDLSTLSFARKMVWNTKRRQVYFLDSYLTYQIGNDHGRG